MEDSSFFPLLSRLGIALLDGPEPFFGHFFLETERIIRKDLPSPAGTFFRDTRYVLAFNPSLFLPLTFLQQQDVIRHELLHILSGHLLRAEALKERYAPFVLVVAMDLSVNPYLSHLPPGYITLAKVNSTFHLTLSSFESMEYYARKLQPIWDKSAENVHLFQKTFGPPDTVNVPGALYIPGESHTIWSESTSLDPSLMQAFHQEMLARAGKVSTSEYMARLLASFSPAPGPIPWSVILKTLTGKLPQGRRRSVMRRNRRQPLRLELPGELGRYRANIFLGLDISGSIRKEDFEEALKEILHILQSSQHTLTILEGDDAIRRVYPLRSFRDLLPRLRARGGTAFSPYVNYVNAHNGDLLIMLTDGKGESHLKNPPRGYPVLWVLSGRNSRLSLKESFGPVVPLQNHTSPKVTLTDIFRTERGGFSMNNQERDI